MGRRGRMGAARGMNRGPARAGGARKASQIGEKARQRLQEAAQQAKDGNWAEAAQSYEALSNGAASKNMTGMAVKMMIRAGRAHYNAGNKDQALAKAKEAVALGDGVPQKKRLARKFRKILAHLREQGDDAMAQELEDHIKQKYGLKEIPQAAEGSVNRDQRRNLPKRCGTCNAPVEGGKVEWNDDGSADCTFCGTVL